MGWLNTVLDIASLGVNIANASKIEQLRMQGTTTAIIQAIIKELRDQIFRYKQTAEEILAVEEKTTPKVTAGAMRLLELRLQSSGITPDLFVELGDKDYVASTTRFIRENSARLIGKLSQRDRDEVQEVSALALRLPDYSFYVENYEIVQNYRKALPIVKKLKKQNTPLQRLTDKIAPPSFALLTWGFAWMMSSMAMDSQQSSLICGGGFLLGVAAAAGIYLMRKSLSRPEEYDSAKAIVDEVENKQINLDHFAQLEKEFGANVDKIEMTLEQAKSRVQEFFGDAPLLIG